MKILLDGEACVGHGRCYALAPEVYEPDDMGRCVLTYEDVPVELEDAARRGAQACPEDALRIEE